MFLRQVKYKRPDDYKDPFIKAAIEAKDLIPAIRKDSSILLNGQTGKNFLHSRSFLFDVFFRFTIAFFKSACEHMCMKILIYRRIYIQICIDTYFYTEIMHVLISAFESIYTIRHRLMISM